MVAMEIQKMVSRSCTQEGFGKLLSAFLLAILFTHVNKQYRIAFLVSFSAERADRLPQSGLLADCGHKRKRVCRQG